MNTIIERNADFSLDAGNKRVVVRYRNPSRVFGIQVSADAWNLADVPERYRAMLESVLDSAAVSILKTHIDSFSAVPTSIDASKFSQDALIDAATSSNSNWLSKEELSDLWKASATRKKFYTDARYASNGAYRKAVAKFEELVLKLSGKSAKIEHDDLDKILVKLDDSDLETELGSFIVKRIEAMKAKPVVDSIDMDLLPAKYLLRI
jgi:prophage maintenance system killer protein